MTVPPPTGEPQRGTSISLCLIVRNEESFLDDCLRSAAPGCTEIVVVDTGSRDRTVEIARRHTHHVHCAGALGDFASARNLALERATGDWILFLDADERLAPSSLAHLGDVVAGARDDELGLAVLRYHLLPGGGFASDYVLRLFRNLPELRYRGRIGESVASAIDERGGRVVRAPLTINHYGNWRARAVRFAKARSYAQLLSTRLKETPDDAVLRSSYAMTTKKLGHVRKALRHTTEAVRLAPDSPTVRTHHGVLLRAVGDQAGALDQFRRAADAEAETRVGWKTETSARNMVGVMLLTLGRLDEAEATLAQAREDGPRLTHVLVNRGLVEQARGALSAATVWYEQAAEENSALLADSWAGRLEFDPYPALDSQTVVGFAGLAYHLALCRGVAL